MLARTLAFVGCVFAFVAVVVPREEAPAGYGAANSGTASADAAQQAQANSDWNAGDMTLQREGDGHFYASAMIDGAATRLMVDTGASVIALTGEDAAAAGLDWDDNDIQPIGRGASGTIYGVRARLSEVAIGNMVRRNVDAIIVPEGLDISLLGQSFLAQVGSVEINGDTMVLNGS
jgi:aspartyl protease family protein